MGTAIDYYNDFNLLYGSDTRGTTPFYPVIQGDRFKTLQIPTTLPTLDELLGLPEHPEPTLPAHYSRCLKAGLPNVWTLHAELEGQSLASLFEQILDAMEQAGARFTTLEAIANSVIEAKANPTAKVGDAPVFGRTGLLACQEAAS